MAVKLPSKCSICGTSNPKTLSLCCHPQCPVRTVAKPYTCAVCGTQNPDTFVRCYHPMCPDGHDQPGRFPSYPPAPRRVLTADERKGGRVLLLVALFAIISMIYSCTFLVLR